MRLVHPSLMLALTSFVSKHWRFAIILLEGQPVRHGNRNVEQQENLRPVPDLPKNRVRANDGRVRHDVVPRVVAPLLGLGLHGPTHPTGSV